MGGGERRRAGVGAWVVEGVELGIGLCLCLLRVEMGVVVRVRVVVVVVVVRECSVKSCVVVELLLLLLLLLGVVVEDLASVVGIRGGFFIAREHHRARVAPFIVQHFFYALRRRST